MAIWQIMLGFGLGLFATIFTIANTRRNRAIQKCGTVEYFSSPNEKCVICLEDMSNNEMNYLPCGHATHERCLKELKKHNHKLCPTCRRDI